MQREARERVRTLSERIKAANTQRLAASAPPRPKPSEPNARQRAADYARTSVPRPETLKQQVRSVSAPAKQRRGLMQAAGGSSAGGSAEQQQQQQPASGGVRAPLDMLQSHHDEYAARVEAIRAELGRSMVD